MDVCIADLVTVCEAWDCLLWVFQDVQDVVCSLAEVVICCDGRNGVDHWEEFHCIRVENGIGGWIIASEASVMV